MAVIDGPGGPIATEPTEVGSEEPALGWLLDHSPLARQVVLEELSTRLRRKDLGLVSARWSAGIEDELLD